MLMLAALTGAAHAQDSPDWLEQTVSDVLDFYDRNSVLIVGELHGTEETPLLVGALAERLAEDATVVLGLEVSIQEQDRIDAFLRSRGSNADVADLLTGEFWRGRDGRTSEAMLQLFESVRAARASGLSVSVAAIDDETFFNEGVDRRQGLASRITGLSDNSVNESVVVLIGNYHARVTLPSIVRSDGQILASPPIPTAARISEVPITTMNVMACSGQSWACTSPGVCGPMNLPQCDVDAFPNVEATDPNRFGYHLSVTLERLTVSPPVTGNASFTESESSPEP